MTRLIHSVTFYRYGLLSILSDGQAYTPKELDIVYRATTKLQPRKYSPYAAARRLLEAGLISRNYVRSERGLAASFRIRPAGREVLESLSNSFGVATNRRRPRRTA